MKNRLKKCKPGVERIGRPMQNEKENYQDITKAEDGAQGVCIRAPM